MSRQTDHLKFQAWQSRLERHATSGLSVARFCSGERVVSREVPLLAAQVFTAIS